MKNIIKKEIGNNLKVAAMLSGVMIPEVILYSLYNRLPLSISLWYHCTLPLRVFTSLHAIWSRSLVSKVLLLTSVALLVNELWQHRKHGNKPLLLIGVRALVWGIGFFWAFSLPCIKAQNSSAFITSMLSIGVPASLRIYWLLKLAEKRVYCKKPALIYNNKVGLFLHVLRDSYIAGLLIFCQLPVDWAFTHGIKLASRCLSVLEPIGIAPYVAMSLFIAFQLKPVYGARRQLARLNDGTEMERTTLDTYATNSPPIQGIERVPIARGLIEEIALLFPEFAVCKAYEISNIWKEKEGKTVAPY